MIVSFIELNHFKPTAQMFVKIANFLEKLVVEDGADIFLFTNEGAFDQFSLYFLNQLKKQHPNIKCIFCETGYEDDREELSVLELFYNKIVVLHSLCDNNLVAPYVRSRYMILMSDVLVTYFNTDNLQTPRLESVAEEAVKFAKRYKKRVINLYNYHLFV